MPAKINYDYYEGKDVYNDGDIEQILIDEFKKDINYNQKEYKDLAYFYLLTPIRQNILNWYPFDKKSSVLEIGPGAGTITGMLCDRAKKVTVVEASKRRGELIYNRHKNKDNLEIIVGNFNSVKFSEKYDYIVMVGVLEYGEIFSTGDNPYKQFLENIREHLNKNGRLLVAIENKNGLKYWCGANEDHLGKPYIGITGYQEGNIKTFGKKELTNLLNDSGFKYTRFYYPFPDYKMPYSVYTDNHLPNKIDLKSDLLFNHDDQGFFVNPLDTIDNVVDNNLIGDMANSFLVEASVDKEIKAKVDYAKMSNNRNSKYATITTIMNDGTITKSSIFSEGIEHLKNLANTHNLIKKNGLKCSDITMKENTLYIEKIEGETITNRIATLLNNKDKKGILELIDNTFSYIKNKFTVRVKTNDINNKIFKTIKKENEIYILKQGLIDLNFSNIIINNKDLVLIDQEWVTDEQLPFVYIVYFSIKLLYEQIPSLNELIKDEELYKKYDINIKDKKKYDEESEKYFFDCNEVFNMSTYNILLDRKRFIDRKKIESRNEDEINNLLSQLEKTRQDVIDRDETVIFLNKEVKRLNALIVKLSEEQEKEPKPSFFSIFKK